MNLIDILILGCILLGGLQGYRKGLLTGIARFIGSIVGLVVASTQYVRLLHWLEQWLPLRQWIEPYVYSIVLANVQAKSGAIQQDILWSILKMIPPQLRELAGNNLLNIPGLKDISQGAIEEVAHRLSGAITDKLLLLISFAIVYYGVLLLIHLVTDLILLNLGFVGGTLNRGGGFVFGALAMFIGLSVLAGLLSPVWAGGAGGNFASMVQKSFLYHNLVSIFQSLEGLLTGQGGESLLEPLRVDLPKGPWF